MFPKCNGLMVILMWIWMHHFILKVTAAVIEYSPFNEKLFNEERAHKYSYFLKKQYSLSKPYPGNWNFGGSTGLLPDAIRLTSAVESQRGWLSCPSPVTMQNWEVHLQVKVHGGKGKLYGDGLAFWYVHPSTKFSGPVYGAQDKFIGLGVFLDTYNNANENKKTHSHPYLMAMIGNGSVSFDHDKDGQAAHIDGCTAEMRNKNHPTTLAISYIDRVLTVSTDFIGNSKWQRCFQINGINLPTGFTFAISAMTGELYDFHDVITVKVYEVDASEQQTQTMKSEDTAVNVRQMNPESAEVTKEPIDNKHEEPENVTAPVDKQPVVTINQYLLMFALLAAAALVIFALIRFSLHRRERMRKRFY